MIIDNKETTIFIKLIYGRKLLIRQLDTLTLVSKEKVFFKKCKNKNFHLTAKCAKQ